MHDPQKTISAGSKLQGQPKSIKRPCTPQTMLVLFHLTYTGHFVPFRLQPVSLLVHFIFLFNRCSHFATVSRLHYLGCCPSFLSHRTNIVQPYSHSLLHIPAAATRETIHLFTYFLFHISTISHWKISHQKSTDTTRTFERVNHL